jgi:hypothetical protein
LRDFFLTFVTHAGCLLCDEAEPVVRRVARRSRVPLAVVDMGSDDELARRYALRVPVVLGPGGEVLAEGIIEGRELRQTVADAKRRH